MAHTQRSECRREVARVTTNSAEQPVPRPARGLSVDELFRNSEPVRSADDLTRDEVFDKGEVEAFLADLRAMCRADLA
jgi:hypothetical protein